MLHPGGWSNGTKSNALWCAPPSVLPLCLARAVATAISIRCRSLIHQRKRAFAGNQRTPLDVMVVELAGLRRVSHQIRQSPYKSRTWKKHYKAPLCPVHQGRLKSVPPECDPQCAPCQSTLPGAFADVGSIPRQAQRAKLKRASDSGNILIP